MSSQNKLPVSFKDRLPVAEDLPFFAYSNATPIGQKPPTVCGWLSFYQPSTLVTVPSQWHPSYTHFLPNTTTKPTQTPDQLIAQFVGEGYRLLGRTELIEEGDEWFDDCIGLPSRWQPALRVGEIPYSGTYRRKIAATKPNLWRQLDRSEKVLEGDVLVDEGRLDHVTVDLTANKIPNSRPSVNWRARHEGKQASHGVYFRRLPVGLPEPVKLAVDPGEGYVLLAEGTKLETGDEYYDAEENVWDKTNYAEVGKVGDKGCPYTYRRKIKAATPAIEPGAGYRLLGDNEEILPTDEYFNPDTTSQWKTDEDGGDTPRDRRSSGFSGLQFRRKLPEPQITIPAGYRTLRVGDIFAATDKAFYKSSGQVRDLASWLVGHVVKDHDLLPGLPLLWLRPITTAAEPVPHHHTGKLPPAGYRWLKEGEKREVGDVYDPSLNPVMLWTIGHSFENDCILRPLVSGTTTVAESGVSWGTVVNKSIVGVVIDPRDKKIAELEDHVANLQRKGQRQREALNKQQDSIKRLQEEKAQASLEHSCALETYKRQQSQSAIIAHGKTAWDARRVFDDRPAARIQSLQDLANTPGGYQVLSTEQAKALTSYVDALESTLTRIAL